MKIYELTNKGCETVDDCISHIVFHADKICHIVRNDTEMKLEYILGNMQFDINRSYFSILRQDIHNNIPCGMLFVLVPTGEDFDTIIYIVRFEATEFEEIKKIYLTNFPK